MSLSSFSSSLFDKLEENGDSDIVRVDNFNEDVLDFHQRDAQVTTLDFRKIVGGDIEMEIRAPER